MPKTKAFISFDFDNDASLRDLLVGQAAHPDSPFDIVDRSLREALVGDWKAKIRERIRRADLVVVLCGERTHTASGVAIEMQIARDLGKPHFLLAGYSNRTCTKPTCATTNDKMYNWTWDNLKLLIGGAR